MFETVTEENNQITLTGEISTELQYSHTSYGEDFYRMEMFVERLSKEADILQLVISGRLIDVKGDYRCERVQVTGQLRSYHQKVGEKSQLHLMVFVKDISFIAGKKMEAEINDVFLDGFICRTPKYRKTPKKREIADFLLAVNRTSGKVDYIPCICWGRNARFMGGAELGKHLQIWGRIQSREYIKKGDRKEIITRCVYEVSVNRLG